MCVEDLAHSRYSVNLSSFLLTLPSPWETLVQGEALGWGQDTWPGGWVLLTGCLASGKSLSLCDSHYI